MKYIFVLFFLFGLLQSNAQQRKLDSLLNLYEHYTPKDSLKVNYLLGIVFQYARLKDYANVEHFTKIAIQIAEKLPRKRTLLYVYERTGFCYQSTSSYLKAIEYYTKGAELALLYNDPYEAGRIYLNMGALYLSIPDYSKALEANEKAIQSFLQVNDIDNASSCYMNVGEVYLGLQQPIKAIEYINKALPEFQKYNKGNNYGVCEAYRLIATAYLIASEEDMIGLGDNMNNKYSKSLEYLFKALNIAYATKDVPLSSVINHSIGDVYTTKGNWQLARKHYDTALGFSESIVGREEAGNIYFSLGKLSFIEKKFTEALNHLRKSYNIGKQVGFLRVQQNSLQTIGSVYESLGKYDSALLYHKQYILIRDSIYGKEKEKEIFRKQLQLDYTVKENVYKLQDKLNNQKLFQQEQALVVKQQQLKLLQKDKDLQRIIFLQKQSELQNQQQQQALQNEQKNQQVKFEQALSSKQINEQQIQIKYDESIKLYLGIAILLAFAFVFFMYKSQRKTAYLNKVISTQKNELEKLSNVKDKIFSVVSHDMRTPVNSLISFIQLLENNTISSEKLYLYAEQLKHQLSHTSGLMENLLKWASSQMQGFKPNIVSLNIAEIIEECTTKGAAHIDAKQIKIINTVGQGLIVMTDKNMLTLIVRNILSNAVKFTNTKGCIQIAAIRKNEFVEISIKDNGIGMSKEKLDQVNGVTISSIESSAGTLNEKGTGLGLMLCKTFAQLMKAEFEVKSTEGEGAQFLITLPIQNA
jgi:signal transduction histidine kinase